MEDDFTTKKHQARGDAQRSEHGPVATPPEGNATQHEWGCLGLTEYHGQWAQHSFLTVLRLQVQDQGAGLASSDEDPLPGPQMAAVLLYPHEVERESSGLFLFL